MIVIAEDWDWHDVAGGWTRRLLPGAWPWRIERRDDDEDEPNTYFWVAEIPHLEHLRDLLHSVAEDEARVLITDYSLDWLYHPYDGGGDVIARSPGERDRLREKYADWLSSRPDGL